MFETKYKIYEELPDNDDDDTLLLFLTKYRDSAPFCEQCELDIIINAYKK
jgi:hypothetical protein